jgi:hypothetical protein
MYTRSVDWIIIAQESEAKKKKRNFEFLTIFTSNIRDGEVFCPQTFN